MALHTTLSRHNSRPVSPRRQRTIEVNQRADYYRRIGQAPDNRRKIARAAEAVRAAGKDFGDNETNALVEALLGLAGLSTHALLNDLGRQLIQQAADTETIDRSH